MYLPLKIAGRYFFSRRSSGGFNVITIISAISLLGYAIGAAALIIILSVFNGFENLFVSMYSSFDADVQITAAAGKTFDPGRLDLQKIRAIDGIDDLSYVLEENVMLRYDDKQTIATAKGVEKKYTSVAGLETAITRGQLLLSSGDTSFTVVGQGLAYQLGIDPDNQFNYLSVYVPKKGKPDMLDPQSSFSRAFIFPAGVFSIQDEVDNKYLLLPLPLLHRLLDKGNVVSAIEIRLKDKGDMKRVRSEVADIAGEDFRVKNRFEQRESFFKVMRSEKTYSYLILVFILLIAAFNSIGSLYMLVIEKKKDLGTFNSMGLQASDAAMIFRMEGMLIAVVGGTLGILLGFAFCLVQQEYGLINLNNSGSFVVNAYPVSMKAMDFVKVFFTLLALGFLTSIYPAQKAKSLGA
jgi:lipoprotein-releasing system permease protein